MRIVCPRCVAQYEVDEAAIPESGREVQCANCDNIWFQDYIEMLPDRPVDSSEDFEDKGVFDNLDDLPELNFRSKRAQTPAPNEIEDDEGIADDTLEEGNQPAAPRFSTSNDDYDDDEYDDDEYDDAPSPDVRAAPVAEDVLNVLRSEAAFSSASAARDKLDAAAADAIDGDGEDRKIAVDRALAQQEEQQDVYRESGSDSDDQDAADFAEEAPRGDGDDAASQSPSEDSPLEPRSADTKSQDDDFEGDPDGEASGEDDELGFDGLSEFLDAHADNASDEDTDDANKDTLQPDPSAPEPREPTDARADDEDADPGFDPLADLEAIRSQLETIGASHAAETEQEPEAVNKGDEEQYTPILPSDDPLPEDNDEELRNPYAQDDSLDTEDAVTEDLSLADIEGDDEDFIEIEEDRARHAYRADKAGASAAADDVDSPDDEDTPKGGVAAAAIMGLSRPKAKSGRGRARVKQGFGLEEDTDPSSLSPLEEGESEPAGEMAGSQLGRKSLLPDVDELDASLRSDGGEPRRRDREMREAHEEELARKSGGFRRAFVWTVFVFAILIALYLLHPLIVAGMPSAAVVLDPYASAIDSLRLMIERQIGG